MSESENEQVKTELNAQRLEPLPQSVKQEFDEAQKREEILEQNRESNERIATLQHEAKLAAAKREAEIETALRRRGIIAGTAAAEAQAEVAKRGITLSEAQAEAVRLQTKLTAEAAAEAKREAKRQRRRANLRAVGSVFSRAAKANEAVEPRVIARETAEQRKTRLRAQLAKARAARKRTHHPKGSLTEFETPSEPFGAFADESKARPIKGEGAWLSPTEPFGSAFDRRHEKEAERLERGHGGWTGPLSEPLTPFGSGITRRLRK